MKKIILLIALTTSAVQVVYSQFKNPSEQKAQEFVQRKTLYVEDFFDNEDQKNWFRSYWKFDQTIIIKSTEEIEEIVKEKRTDVNILSAGVRNEAFATSSRKILYQAFMLAAYLGDDAKRWNDKDVDVRRKQEVFKLSLSYGPSSEQEFKYIGQHFYNYITAASGSKSLADKVGIDKETIASLANKTLLISDQICELSKEEIQKVYTYPFKLVDDEYVANAVLVGTSGEVYLSEMFSDEGFAWALFSVDTETGKVLNRIGMGGVQFTMSVPIGDKERRASFTTRSVLLEKRHLALMNKIIMKSAPSKKKR